MLKRRFAKHHRRHVVLLCSFRFPFAKTAPEIILRITWFYSSLEKNPREQTGFILPRENPANRLVLFFPGEKPCEQTSFILPQRKPRPTDWFYFIPEKTAANRLVLFYPRENRSEQTSFTLPQRKPPRTDWFHSTSEKNPANRLVLFSLNYM